MQKRCHDHTTEWYGCGNIKSKQPIDFLPLAALCQRPTKLLLPHLLFTHHMLRAYS